MSTSAPSAASLRSSEMALAPALAARHALSGRHAALCLGFGLLWMYFSYLPLFHSDLWCHVHYGTWMLEHGRLPAEDPVAPLLKGVPVVHTAWLGQVLLAAAYRWAGPHGLSCLFAAVVLLTYLLYGRSFYLLGGAKRHALGGVLLMLLIGFSRHSIVRPEIFGSLALAGLIWMLCHTAPWRTRARGFKSEAPSRAEQIPVWLWAAAPLLMIFWANAHGSFAVGLVLLACHAGGALWEAGRRRGALRMFADPAVRQWTLLTELCTVAALVNPHGIDLLVNVAMFGSNPNLPDVLEWMPPAMKDLEGLSMCLAAVLLMAALRHSRQRVRAADVMMLAFFAAAVVPSARMIGWFAPIFVLCLTPHWADIRRRLAARRNSRKPRGERSAPSPEASGAPPRFAFAWTLICGLILWSSLALSPTGRMLLGRPLRSDRQVYSRMTPLGATEYLRKAPPAGLVMGPQWWGDWLTWDGGVSVLMTTNVHLAPHQLWKDYLSIARGNAGWQRRLDQYGVQTLVIHKKLQQQLDRAARSDSAWQVVYEDQLAVILARKERS